MTKTMLQRSKVYEMMLPKTEKMKKGIFYTNDINIIKYMLSNINVLCGKILEPSCGSGIFLFLIIEEIIKQLKVKNYSEFEVLEYISNNIYANDIDKNAIMIAKTQIELLLKPLINKVKLKQEKFEFRGINFTNYDFVFEQEKFDCKFDLIVGNPPFVTMYGKRSKGMTEEKRKYFNSFNFVKNKKGNNKFNLNMFFIENSLKLLKFNGILSFILDISFLEDAYIDLREYLLNHTKILNYTHNINGFENVRSGQIILNLENVQNENYTVNIFDYLEKINKVHHIEEWKTNKKYKFSIPLDEIERDIINKIKQYPKLDEMFENKSLRTCCALTGRTDDFITSLNIEENDNVFSYIEGSKGLSGKFSKLTPFRNIKYDYDLQIKISDEFKEELGKKGIKNKKRVTLGDRECYLKPKIFIRQSAKELIATYTEDKIMANNSIYILTNNKRDDIDSKNKLKYVCALMNSNLLTYYALKTEIIRSGIGKIPQLKISDLKKLPILILEEKFEIIIKITEDLLANINYEENFKKLNNEVYNIYSMTFEEINIIEGTIINN